MHVTRQDLELQFGKSFDQLHKVFAAAWVEEIKRLNERMEANIDKYTNRIHNS